MLRVLTLQDILQHVIAHRIRIRHHIQRISSRLRAFNAIHRASLFHHLHVLRRARQCLLHRFFHSGGTQHGLARVNAQQRLIRSQQHSRRKIEERAAGQQLIAVVQVRHNTHAFINLTEHHRQTLFLQLSPFAHHLASAGQPVRAIPDDEGRYTFRLSLGAGLHIIQETQRARSRFSRGHFLLFLRCILGGGSLCGICRCLSRGLLCLLLLFGLFALLYFLCRLGGSIQPQQTGVIIIDTTCSKPQQNQEYEKLLHVGNLYN